MQYTKIALALAVAFTAAQVNAAPVTQQNIIDAVAANDINQSWISGASAPSANIGRGFIAGCDADSITTFTSTTRTQSSGLAIGSLGNVFAYACTIGGKVSVLYHTIEGGSFTAYTPHIVNDVDGDGVNSTDALIRVDALEANGSCVQKANVVFDGKTIGSYTNCSASTSQTTAPVGGFSDVEAALWGISSDDVVAVGEEGATGILQGFGVAVNAPLYRQLQVKQGIYSNLTAAEADTTFAEDKKPNISRAEYATIATGQNTNWLTIAGVDAPIYLERRASTSGTQASSNAFFLNTFCKSSGGLTPATQADVDGSGMMIAAHPGTGDVRNALNLTTNYRIGVVSLENGQPSAANQWKFVKVDGVSPTAGDATNQRLTTQTGQYVFSYELKSFKATSSPAVLANPEGWNEFGHARIDAIVQALGNPPSVGACSNVPRGLSLLPSAEAATTCAATGQTAKVERNGNNCQELRFF